MWERYDVKAGSRRSKTFHHPEVGDLALGYQSLLPVVLRRRPLPNVTAGGVVVPADAGQSAQQVAKIWAWAA
ncbi:hypothetical protein [Streptomyces cupreus]|uniref:MmyB family transcriptional regulator n=1 Tax=Streptomyces cupreus TaxID=2759956 RepID=UPI003AB98753